MWTMLRKFWEWLVRKPVCWRCDGTGVSGVIHDPVCGKHLKMQCSICEGRGR